MNRFFFDLLNIPSQGLTFERIFWALVVCLGLIVCAWELRARRPVADAWYTWALGVLLTGFGGFNLVRALFLEKLYFGDDGLQLSTYGVAVALGFVVGIYLIAREARRSPGPPGPGHVLDLSFWILIWSMVGSRLLFVIVGWRNYYDLCFAPELVEGSGGVSDCFAVLKFWQGGMVFFGGFIAAVVTSVVYCRRNRISFMRTADVFIPGLALGHFFGRLGCLAAGCCFGRPCSVSWGISMPAGSPAFEAQTRALLETDPQVAMALIDRGHSLLVHPTQLYEASAELAFFAFLLLLRAHKRFHGQLLATWLILYSAMRFGVELFRGDRIRGYLFELNLTPVNRLLGIDPTEATLLTTSQAISLASGLLGVVLYVWLSRQPLTTRLPGGSTRLE